MAKTATRNNKQNRMANEACIAQEALRLRSKELHALARVVSILSEPGTFEGTFETKAAQVLEDLAEIVQADWVTLRQEDETGHGLRLVAAAGPATLASPPMPILTNPETIARDALRQERSVVINDYLAHPNASPRIVALGMKSVMMVPIKSSGQAKALLNVISRQANHFTPDRVDLLMVIADAIGTLLANARMAHELRDKLNELDVLTEVSKIITSNLDLSVVYEQFASEVKKLVDVEWIGIILIDEASASLKLAYLSEQVGSVIKQGETIPLKGTLTEHVMRSQRTLICGDLTKENRFWTTDWTLEKGLRSAITVPLIVKQKIVGGFVLLSRRYHAFGPQEQSILERLANQIAPVIENTLIFQERDRLASALESIGDAVAFLDLSGYIQFTNRAFDEMYGSTREEIRGEAHISTLIPDDPYAEVLAKEAFDQGGEGGWKGEVKRLRNDGAALDVLLTVTPVKNNTREVIGRIDVSRDITERKRTEQRMQETARLASIGELSAGVAHELNNPLAGILGLSQLITAEDLPEQVLDDIRNIYREAQRATRIVQSLLSFARKYEPNKLLVNLAEILRKVLEFKSHDFKVNNIQVNTVWPEQVPEVMGDENQLIQVILNILTNAEQAMLGSHRRGVLDIIGSDVGDRIKITFADNGNGIPPENLRKVFDPFFTTKRVGEGTGLGLSICYGIIREHGGEMWAESTLRDGASIHLELPIPATTAVQVAPSLGSSE